jgi:hypothetical protein
VVDEEKAENYLNRVTDKERGHIDEERGEIGGERNRSVCEADVISRERE